MLTVAACRRLGLVIGVCCSLVLLFALYRRPLISVEDVGAHALGITGLHEPQSVDGFSYAYTQGDAGIRFPQVGVANFAVDLRMGGPQGSLPVTAQIVMPLQTLGIGTVERIRSYHLLLPATQHGNLDFQLQSETRLVASDPRALGLLLDWVRLRSLGATWPPVWGVLSVPGLWLLLWLMLHPFGGALVSIVKITLAWRLALWMAGAAGLWFSRSLYSLGKAMTHHGRIAERDEFVWNTFVGAWIQWDAVHYQTIALNGYSFAGERYPNIAFFPLYPLLIRFTLPLTRGNLTLAPLIVSQLAFLVGLVVLSDLLKRDFSASVAQRTLVLLLLFPTSLFFAAAYTESLAFALVVAVLWALRRQNWWMAGAAGFFLALTRLPGVMMTPVLLVAYAQHCEWQWRKAGPALLAAFLPVWGLVCFMFFQWRSFDTPLAFLIAQQSWENRMSPPWVMPWVLLRAVSVGAEWPMAVFQAATWMSFVGLMFVGLRRLPLVYGLTAVLMLAPAYLSNFPWSLPRHVLIGVPAFISMAVIAEEARARRIIFGLFGSLLVIAVVLFVNSFWVA